MERVESAKVAPVAEARKPYAPPTLVLFGEVAALTQGSSCSEPNDNETAACTPGSMGMNISDRRAKTDIVRVGTHPRGFGLYLFDYKPEFQARWGTRRQFGVMADEVEPLVPAAVVLHDDGYKRVCYEMLGIRRVLH
jgi:hypothetical protein